MKKSNLKKPAILAGAVSLALFSITPAHAAVGNLLWEDNFDTLNTDTWTVDVGDGCDQGVCGWGNAELQWYAESNTYVEAVPGETGNSALVLEARTETSNGYAFTSGKVQSSDKIAVQYGMVEVRMMVPDVGIGLWPAAWMLGTSTQSWPAKGEIDMMEMGQSTYQREAAGFPDADINSYTGSNLIFYTEAACSDGNATCAASLAWETDNAHLSSTPLSNRFVTYRTYWTETEIRFTVEDNGVEYDMFDAPFTITEEANEFQAPFYLLMNLAVGGNFTDAATNDQVTATTPAKMYIDYVRVYELDGQGEVFIGNQTVPEAGVFGVFTDTTATNNKLEAGETSDIYVWNGSSVSTGTIEPVEGDNVIAWNYTSSNEWFGGGIQSRQAIDLSNFDEQGALTFKIKIPADVAFKIGIEDTYTNQNWVEFPANTTTYGLSRDGEWATATIPAADMRGDLIALQSLKGLFYIASLDAQLPTASFEMAIDDIVWTGGGEVISTDSDGDGVDDLLDNCANTPTGTIVDSSGCAIELVTDSDNDGVSDSDDLCPDTTAGSNVDATGCEVVVAQSVLIQAEDYTAFTDTTDANLGGQYRSDAVDIQVTDDENGGYNVGWIASGETLDYSVELAAGTYDLTMRVASPTTGSYTLLVDGDIIDSSTVATNGWQAFETQALGSVTLEAGEHTLRMIADSGSFNFNWLNLDLNVDTPVDDETPIDVDTDSDNDGVLDSVDKCLDTEAGAIVDASGCEVVNSEKLGVTVESGTSIAFFVNTSGWADVHYMLNGAGQQNFRMSNDGSSNARVLSGLTDGDVIEYSFTYQDDDGSVQSSDWVIYTFSGDTDVTEPCSDCDGDELQVYGITVTSTDSADLFVNVDGWADAHYIVNNGGQRNVRMINSSTGNSTELSGLVAGDVIEYSFTYQDNDGLAKDSPWASYTF